MLNRDNPASVAAFLASGTPFSLAGDAVQRAVPARIAAMQPRSRAQARVQTFLMYLNYKPTPLDNISYRLEFFDDKQGQRTGVKTTLRRDRPRLAALVLAPDRDPAGSLLLQGARCGCFQRQLESRNCTQQERCADRFGGHHHSLLRRGALDGP